uniref:P2X purinoreceptor 7 intracellular domain-containing protein n=1 Tax=Xenopus tropicalis TaxID=8364 RepID=A0A803KE76_XENTR
MSREDSQIPTTSTSHAEKVFNLFQHLYTHSSNLLGNNNWCRCSNCSPMQTVMECVCCHEKPAIKALIPEHASCIVDLFHNRAIRKAAYRSFAAWVYRYLGPETWKVIPACAVTAIRAAFPDPKGKYLGFLQTYPLYGRISQFG